MPYSGTLVEAKYSNIDVASPTTLVLQRSNKYFVLSIASNKVSENAFYSLSNYSEGLFLAQDQKDGLWGYVNSDGSWEISPQFIGARPFCNGLAAVLVNDKWGYIANPLIYTEWSSEDFERGISLGLFDANDSDELLRVSDLISYISRFISLCSHEPVQSDSIYGLLHLDEHSIFKSDNNVTREGAAIALAAIAEYYSMDTHCMLSFLNDEPECNPDTLGEVSFTASYGLFDMANPGYFQPEKEVTDREFKIACIRLYETLIDVTEMIYR